MLDEPTNDLDLETLELLEEELVEWPGTLLLVSHDRAFLDNVVTSTIVFEGDGRVQEYVGGYEDWLRQRNSVVAQNFSSAGLKTCATAVTVVAQNFSSAGQSTRKKLSYKEQRELDALPSRIEALEAEQRDLTARIAGPDFYKTARADIEAALARVDPLAQELTDAYARWHDLESRRP